MAGHTQAVAQRIRAATGHVAVAGSGGMSNEVEASRSRCWTAIVDGLMTQTQVAPMDRAEAESVANRVLEGLDAHRLTVIDRERVAEWLQVAPAKLDPLLAHCPRVVPRSATTGDTTT